MTPARTPAKDLAARPIVEGKADNQDLLGTGIMLKSNQVQKNNTNINLYTHTHII